MKTVMFTEQRDFAFLDRPVPTPGAGEVLLAVELCGICGTDLHAPVLQGLFTSPVVLGHEFTASIAGVGAAVTDLNVGDRVVVNPIALVCGVCPPCRAGFPNQCLKALSEDCCGIGKDGGMAQYVALDAVHIHRLPEGMRPEIGAWTEPLAVAVRGVRRAELQLGYDVAIIGAGPIGQLALQVARASGAGETLVVETSAHRRDIAHACGASRTIAPQDLSHIRRQYHVVLDCTGAAKALDSAIDLVGPGGRIVVIGTYTDAPTLSSPGVAHFKEATITFSICYGDRDEFPAAIGLLERRAIDVEPLTTRISPIEEHAAAFADMRDPERGMKVLLAPGA